MASCALGVLVVWAARTRRRADFPCAPLRRRASSSSSTLPVTAAFSRRLGASAPTASSLELTRDLERLRGAHSEARDARTSPTSLRRGSSTCCSSRIRRRRERLAVRPRDDRAGAARCTRHSHDHRHVDGPPRARDRARPDRRASWSGEVVAGIVAGSLALLADAGHMLTDAAALARALFAATAGVAAGARAAGRSATGAPRSSPRRRTASRCSSSALDRLRRRAAAHLAGRRARRHRARRRARRRRGEPRRDARAARGAIARA